MYTTCMYIHIMLQTYVHGTYILTVKGTNPLTDDTNTIEPFL